MDKRLESLIQEKVNAPKPTGKNRADFSSQKQTELAADVKQKLSETLALLNISEDDLLVFTNGASRGVNLIDENSGGDKWKSVGIADAMGADKLEKFSEKIETLEETLKTTKQALDAVQSLVGVLSSIESVISDPLAAAAESITDYLRKLINSVKSSGVYSLDMISPYLITNPIVEINRSTDTLTENNFPGVTTKDVGRNIGFNSKDKQNQPIQIFRQIKPTTYSAFMQTIADAFLDPYDLPEKGLKGGIRIIKDQAEEQKSSSDEENENSKWSIEFYKNAYDSIPSGRPVFEDGDKVKVIVFSIAAPDVGGIIKLADKFMKFIDERYVKELEANKFIDGFLADTPNFTEIDDLGQAFSLLLANKQHLEVNGVLSGSTEPNFKAISLYAFFASFFDKLDNVLIAVEATFKSSPTKITDALNDIIEEVGYQIEKLTKMMDIITEYIDFIDSIKGFSFNTLEFDATGGNFEIYDKLLNAQGFQDNLVDEEQEQYILGIVLCAGVTSKETLNVDFSEISKLYDENLSEFKDEYAAGKQQASEAQKNLSKIMKMFRA